MENMNKFSIRRTMSLTAMIIRQQPKVYLMRFLVLFGGLAVLTLFLGFLYVDNNGTYYDNIDVWNSEFPMFVFMLFAMGMVYASVAFSDAGKKPSRIALLMLPARNIEKYIARFIIYVPLFVVLFLAAAWLADGLRVVVLSLFYPELSDGIGMLRFELSREQVLSILFLFLIIQSFCWLGAILWPRYSLIKTIVSLFVIGIVYTIFGRLFYLVFISGRRICGVPILDDVDGFSVWVGSMVVICVINYVVAYMRFKETDVIQRIL